MQVSRTKSARMAMHGQIDFREFARAVGTVMNYAVNDVIYRENDPPNFMYIVLSGSVEITSHAKVIETIHEGNALGILSLLDEQPRTTTARARESCELAIMDRRKFRYMVEEIPNFVWYVMDELAHRLRTTNAAL
jgi:CRP/FNR family cyclic AMP-dependent transcriptional regulator